MQFNFHAQREGALVNGALDPEQPLGNRSYQRNGVSPLPTAETGQLQKFVRRAVWRIRLEWLRSAVSTMIWVLLIGAVGWTGAIYWRPELAFGAPVGVGVALALLVLAADAALFWQVDRRRVLLRLDRQFGLADAAVSSSELHGEPSDNWRRKQLAQTIGQLGTRSWDQDWPRRWPRFTGSRR